jgi:hypothetical protein
VLTKNTDIVLTIKSKECTTKGKRMKQDLVLKSKSACSAKAPPKIIAEMISADIDSNKSAHYPAQSPTLSPTRSAMTAGFLASSSGMPTSTFPMRSAPTSAALVKIPPPY